MNSIRNKTLAAFAVIFILFMVVGIFQLIILDQEIGKIQAMKNVTLQTALDADQLKLSVVQVQQFLTDISATRAAKGYDDGFKDAEEWANTFDKTLKHLIQINPDNAKELEDLKRDFDSYNSLGKTMAQAYIEGGPEKGNRIMDTFDKYALTLNAKVDKYRDQSVVGINKTIDDIQQSVVDSKLIISVIFAVILLVCTGIGLLLARAITQPLFALLKNTEKIAEGDLAGTVKVTSTDEVGRLAGTFELMRGNLQEMIKQLNVAVQHVATSSNQLSASAEQNSMASAQITSNIQQVSLGSEQQAKSVELCAQLIGEMSASVQQIAASSQTVFSTAIQTSDMAAEGNQTILTAVQQMDSINNTINRLALVVKELAGRSQEIEQIIEAITGIAGQTNLLALNAAIEAARAGEHGHGFAVVAVEVRKLAEQSAESAQRIAHLISTIQENIVNAVQFMEVGTSEVTEGITVVSSAGKTFNLIQESVNNVEIQIQEVSAATQQMAASANEIVSSITLIAEVAAETSSGTQNVSAAAQEQLASMEEISSSSVSLARMAEELQKLSQKFKV